MWTAAGRRLCPCGRTWTGGLSWHLHQVCSVSHMQRALYAFVLLLPMLIFPFLCYTRHGRGSVLSQPQHVVLFHSDTVRLWGIGIPHRSTSRHLLPLHSYDQTIGIPVVHQTTQKAQGIPHKHNIDPHRSAASAAMLRCPTPARTNQSCHPSSLLTMHRTLCPAAALTCARQVSRPVFQMPRQCQRVGMLQGRLRTTERSQRSVRACCGTS